EFDTLTAPKDHSVRTTPLSRKALPEEEEEGRLSRVDRICRRILALAFFENSLLPRVMEEINLFPESYQRILQDPGGETASRIGMQAAYQFGGSAEKGFHEEFGHLLQELKFETLRRRRDDIRMKIREFERAGREEESLEFLKQFQIVSGEMDGMKR
ncbi:MAG: hypothetical protein Q8R20_02860, partial [Nanoarchaeota archaeon]|nr:hypothetical protein [Nanoarchaeota archaeon]